MTEAQAARRNAISIEVKKDGLQQRQSGDWMLRFTVAAIDMDQRITNAPMGARYQCVLVEVDDDETPKDYHAVARDKWRDLGPAKQAGMRCKEPLFWAYLREVEGQIEVRSEEDAAEAVRAHCNVASRSDLGKVHMTVERIKWADMDNRYQAWKALQRG